MATNTTSAASERAAAARPAVMTRRGAGGAVRGAGPVTVNRDARWVRELRWVDMRTPRSGQRDETANGAAEARFWPGLRRAVYGAAAWSRRRSGAAWPGSSPPSRRRRGSRRSRKPGSAQLALPKACMTAGTSTVRISRASMRIATAMPRPIILMVRSVVITNEEKTTTDRTIKMIGLGMAVAILIDALL